MSVLNTAKLLRNGAFAGASLALADRQRWYAVHTLPLGEARAVGHLEVQGFRTFLPKRRRTIRHARKLSVVEAPFFPRYLFIVLDITRDRWRSVNGTFGVSRLVMRGDEPHPAPHGIVETMIASADAHGILQLASKLRVGASVRLMGGPFAEQIAILDSLDDDGRVRVLLDMLGRRVPISTTAQNVLPLAQRDRPPRRDGCP
jgi:transcription elongation factor/antiterminator RfaH